MSRAYTIEEVREMFLDNVRELVSYWNTVEERNCEEKLSGLAFSILNIFDGTTIGLPAMDILLAPHPDDKAFLQASDENWFEPGMIVNDCYLHELFHK